MRNGNNNATKPVRKLDAEGRILAEYLSARQAAQENGFSYRYLLSCVRKGTACHGMQFEYFHNTFPMPQKRQPSGFQAGHSPYSIYRERRNS